MSTLHLFLVEVNLAVANSMLSFILKCENPKLAPYFMQHFFGALVSDLSNALCTFLNLCRPFVVEVTDAKLKVCLLLLNRERAILV